MNDMESSQMPIVFPWSILSRARCRRDRLINFPVTSIRAKPAVRTGNGLTLGNTWTRRMCKNLWYVKILPLNSATPKTRSQGLNNSRLLKVSARLDKLSSLGRRTGGTNNATQTLGKCCIRRNIKVWRNSQSESRQIAKRDSPLHRNSQGTGELRGGRSKSEKSVTWTVRFPPHFPEIQPLQREVKSAFGKHEKKSHE